MTFGLTQKDTAEITRAVRVFEDRRNDVQTVAENIHNYLLKSAALRPLVHSFKYRVKDPEHLRDKLRRKARDARKEGKEPPITSENLFDTVGDLAGVRVLYLQPRQIEKVLPATLKVLEDFGCVIVEKPFAYVWDDETRDLFASMGVATKYRPELYTSVHFVTKFNSAHFCRCEIQLRTLMEEVWGEVSHTVNYPHETKSVACQEQLKVLARVASGGTRLVDSIFASLAEHEKRLQRDRRSRARKKSAKKKTGK